MPNGGPSPELVLREIGPRDGTIFVTEPFDEPVDLAGRLRGELDFTINKYDVDLVVMLYELSADGEYVKLFEPAFAFRASYARDRVRRRLLLNGVRQQLPFQSDRLIGRRLAAGSRFVMTLGINKRADQQINYGAGRRRQRRIDRGRGRAHAHPLARRQLHRNSVAPMIRERLDTRSLRSVAAVRRAAAAADGVQAVLFALGVAGDVPRDEALGDPRVELDGAGDIPVRCPRAQGGERFRQLSRMRPLCA